jgi:hypothetical protein
MTLGPHERSSPLLYCTMHFCCNVVRCFLLHDALLLQRSSPLLVLCMCVVCVWCGVCMYVCVCVVCVCVLCVVCVHVCVYVVCVLCVFMCVCVCCVCVCVSISIYVCVCARRTVVVL